MYPSIYRTHRNQATFSKYQGHGAYYNFFFHVVLPLTISSYPSPAFSSRRCVYFVGHCCSAPAKLWWPLMISGKSEGPLTMLMFPPVETESSSGWQIDCTTSELPHSFLYSRMILRSWWCCRNWSGIVCAWSTKLIWSIKQDYICACVDLLSSFCFLRMALLYSYIMQIV